MNFKNKTNCLISKIVLGIERSTGNVVKSVRTKYNDDTYRSILDAIFNSIGQIVNTAVDAIDKMSQNPHLELQQISVLQVRIFLLYTDFFLYYNIIIFLIRHSWI